MQKVLCLLSRSLQSRGIEKHHSRENSRSSHPSRGLLSNMKGECFGNSEEGALWNLESSERLCETREPCRLTWGGGNGMGCTGKPQEKEEARK